MHQLAAVFVAIALTFAGVGVAAVAAQTTSQPGQQVVLGIRG